MNSYEIMINVTKLLHYSNPPKSKVDNKTLVMLINSFSEYIRKVYMSMIESKIYSARYKGEWEPVNDPGYLEYIGTTPSEHIIELMYDALEIKSIKRDIRIRFDPSYKYPNSKLTLISVLNAIDTGTSKFNARPLLKSLSRELNASIPRLWRAYLKQKGVL